MVEHAVDRSLERALWLFILLRGQGRLWCSRIFVKVRLGVILVCWLWYVLDGIFEMQKEYIMVEHAVDRSLERALWLWRYV